MNKNIVLDLDGVIADIDSSISQHLSDRGADDYDYSHWLITHHSCKDSDEIMGNPLFWRNLIPFQDAWHEVNYWFGAGYDVYVVTARRTDAAISVTEKWLDDWKINTMPPIFAKMGQKHEVINKINPIFVVEDNPNEVEILLKEGHKTLLRKAWYNEKYWNKLPTIGNLTELKIND